VCVADCSFSKQPSVTPPRPTKPRKPREIRGLVGVVGRNPSPPAAYNADNHRYASSHRGFARVAEGGGA
jgi:hypothetical protein